MLPTNAETIQAYDAMPPERVAGFGDEGDATHRYLLNPTLWALLGEVADTTVLDAGCGQGYLARMLARRGARVTGVEPSAAFFAYCVEHECTEPLAITYEQADLTFWDAPPERFDAAIANMVLMDIPDWLPALHACVAALKPGGKLIVSLLHPCFEEGGAAWKGKGAVEVRDYFDERARPQDYGAFVHRPLSTYLNAIIESGCTLEQFVEPRLERAIAEELDAERYWAVPGYLVILAVKQ